MPSYLHFFDLPAELRIMIYKRIFKFPGGKLLHPAVLNDGPVLMDHCTKTTVMRREHTRFWIKCYNFALTCRQIRNEAVPIFRRVIEFIWEGLHYSTMCMPNKTCINFVPIPHTPGVVTYMELTCDECGGISRVLKLARELAEHLLLGATNTWVNNPEERPIGWIQLKGVARLNVIPKTKGIYVLEILHGGIYNGVEIPYYAQVYLRDDD